MDLKKRSDKIQTKATPAVGSYSKPSTEEKSFHKGKADVIVHLGQGRTFKDAFVKFVGGSTIDFMYEGKLYTVPTQSSILIWQQP